MNDRTNRCRHLLHRIGDAIMDIAEGLENQGDRVYLGSTNDADTLKELSKLYQAYRWDTGGFGDDEDPEDHD